jgi:DNA-directed RNA polymerase subunit RPC12/RpoP
MKVRLGFVSNSSSSSFVCEVCGDSFESYDEGPAHFGLVMCEGHDHLFCEAHRINPKEKDENDHDVYTMIECDDDDRIDSIHCPICQLKVITKDMVLDYALHKLGMKYNNIAREIEDVCDTYDELYNEINGTGSNFSIELTAHTRVTAANKDLAYRKARQQVVENSIEMLDVTHCEEI